MTITDLPAGSAVEIALAQLVRDAHRRRATGQDETAGGRRRLVADRRRDRAGPVAADAGDDR